MKIQAIVTSVILFAVACQASAQNALLKSYRADYVVKYDSFTIGKSTTTLTVNNHHYQLCITNVTTVPFLSGSINECSYGQIEKDQVLPQTYTYDYKHNQTHKTINIQFNWPQHIAVIQAKGTEWKTKIPDNTQDRVSYQLTIRQGLAKQTHFSFPVADGGKIKMYQFNVVGKENIATPLQQFNTIKLVRLPIPGKENVTLWLAPELDNIAVRVQQTKHIVDSGTAEIVGYHA